MRPGGPGDQPYLPRDFTACGNFDCGLRNVCWRARPAPGNDQQSWGTFLPVVEDGKTVSCGDGLPLPFGKYDPRNPPKEAG